MTILKQVGDIGFLVSLITSVVLATLAFMIGNAMMHTFHERIPELAVMKTLGFSSQFVALMTVAESLLVCALGAGGGLGLAYMLAPVVNRRLPVIELSQTGLLPGIAMAMLLAIAVALIPAWRAQKLQIVDALATKG
jgi:putative ABC transport system permease protein